MAADRLTDDLRLLVERARAASTAAYAPYSQNRVGAAVRCGSGRVYVGCNVENASFPVTLCAERNAVGTALAAGEGSVEAIAVAPGDPTVDTITPCGMCRQFLAEFGPAVQIVSLRNGGWTVQSVGDLLPAAFSLERGRRTTEDRTAGLDSTGTAVAAAAGPVPAPVANSAPGTAPAAAGGLDLHRVARASPVELNELAVRDGAVFGHTSLRAVDFSVISWAGAVFDARVAGETIGSCQLVRTWDDPTAAWVVGFYVLPEFRGRGLGRELLWAVAEEAVSAGLRRLLLTVGPENAPALNLYQSFGFVVSETLPDFYGHGEDRYLLAFEVPIARSQSDAAQSDAAQSDAAQSADEQSARDDV